MSVESPAHDGRSPLHPALSMRQGYAILEEIASVQNLMRASIDAIRTMGYVRLDGDPAFAVGSLGVEKLMKLILGCASIADSGAWPTERKLQRWGHDIEKVCGGSCAVPYTPPIAAVCAACIGGVAARSRSGLSWRSVQLPLRVPSTRGKSGRRRKPDGSPTSLVKLEFRSGGRFVQSCL